MYHQLLNAPGLIKHWQYLMVDIVVNHNAWSGAPDTVDYANFNPFNSESYYHPYCSPDYGNITSTEVCWQGDTTVPLPDLRTEDGDVASMYQDWIGQLVANYSIDGIRMDTALEVDPNFWADFSEAAGIFITGEVDDPPASVVCPYQNYLDSVLNYPLYHLATAAFTSTTGSISALVQGINDVKADCKDSTLLGSFTENHDQPRFAQQTEDWSLAKNIIAFTILQDGIPIIYEGQEQHYDSQGGIGIPFNREAIWFSEYNTSAELYQHVKTLNAIRKRAIGQDDAYLTYKNWVTYNDSTIIGMKKGSVITVLTNVGQDASSSSVTLESGSTAFAANEQILEVIGCTILTTDGNADVVVPMNAGLPRVLYPLSGLSGSGICGQ